MFTLAETKTNAETHKKLIQTSTQMPIGLCVNVPVSESVSMSDNVSTPLEFRFP